MPLVSIGDMSQAFLMRRQMLELKSDMQRHLTEVVTGQSGDLTEKLRGDHNILNAIDASLSRIDAFNSVTAELRLLARTMQTALGNVDDMASSLAPLLVQSASPINPVQVNATAKDAHQRFQSAVMSLNARAGDRTLFAGQETEGPALIHPQMILAALDAEIVGLVTATDIETAVKDWFDDPLGFDTIAYVGGAPRPGIAVSDSETATLGITALDPAIKDTLRGFAMAALLDRGALAGSEVGRADLARRAGNVLFSAQVGRTQLASGLGVTEAQIEAAETANGAERTSLGAARNELTTVDTHEVATRLKDTEAQLQMIFTLTARLSSLKLVDYLR